MTEGQRQKAAESVFARFSSKGKQKPITRAALDKLRQDILAKRFPAIIPTDYKEGWYRWSEHTISQLMDGYRTRMGARDHRIRGFFPLFEGTTQRASWVTGESHPRVAADYSKERFLAAIDSGARLHGYGMVIFGGATWGQVQHLGQAQLKKSIDEIREDEKQAA